MLRLQTAFIPSIVVIMARILDANADVMSSFISKVYCILDECDEKKPRTFTTYVQRVTRLGNVRTEKKHKHFYFHIETCLPEA